MAELIELLEAAGHSDFRDARGPMGFTQRQASGKFTRDEADEFIERLRLDAAKGEGSSDSNHDAPDPNPSPGETPAILARPGVPKTAAGTRASLTPAEKQLRRIPTAELAAELQRRGWIVVEP